ncbi:serine hydrolase domain-containing protein [Streptomyces sp. SID5910]|uniref:serine hydrolase domain-containing protein n=1 Tax=Streptomyces sp. SID5910 TaxID=2690312 RepID=UPI0013692BC9|nr:serine hydrolase domain-containing protein [Streptomyces sp. SID5910]MYR43947.1 serine hydrolase [Streptomyces sp. SID5910]
MTARTTALAASLVLALAAGPLAAPAFAAPHPSGHSHTHTEVSPNADALRAAVAVVPNEYATSALVRVGGTDGTWRGSAGVRDLASGRPADPDALFRAGSVTKVVTAATVLRLAAEGDVDLDAPIQRYLPGVFTPAFDRPISVRQLLNHTSGIPAGSELGADFSELYAHRFDTLTPRQVVASAVAKGPEFGPGERQHYLNINYTVLGLLIEKVTGRSYAAEATRLVLRPAGMRHTYFPGTDPCVRGPHNRGYQAVERPDGTTELVDVTDWNQADRWAAGDMISTTADLERLITSLFRGRIVPQPQLEEMFTTPPGLPDATRSAGLEYKKVGNRIFWGKSGSRYGYSTLVGGARDLSVTLVTSITSTDAKSAEANPVLDGIAAAALS